MNSIDSQCDLYEKFAGVVLGTAVGDALGLPAENLSPEKIRTRWKTPWRMRFVFGRGMISDDTEHTLMVAQALLSHPDDPEAFQKALAWKFRWWFAALPGGVGLATAKAALKLWIGFPASKAAVASAGSGPAMRSAIIGAYFFDDAESRRAFTLTSSRLTHRGWQAEVAALAVAEAASAGMTKNPVTDVNAILKTLRNLSGESEWQSQVSDIETSLRSKLSVSEFAHRLGLDSGVTGYSLHVVPVALYAWLRYPADFRQALTETIACGGDTDTVGAILGALIGVTNGVVSIPGDWRSKIWEWPRSINYMEKLAAALAHQSSSKRPHGFVRYCWPGVIPRNLLFLIIVIFHGFRRLLPF